MRALAACQQGEYLCPLHPSKMGGKKIGKKENQAKVVDRKSVV